MSGPQTDPLGPEVWRGGVNTWDCDEMGHLNVRFYVAIAMEGLNGLAGRLGLAYAFTPHANATLIVREHHIRFLREAVARTPLHMTAGVVEIGESEALILQVLTHSETGEPCAAVQTRVAHVTREMRPFPWTTQMRKRAGALAVAVPAYATARSLRRGPLAELDEKTAGAATVIGRGAFCPADCDVFGRMGPQHVIGRISDGVPRLTDPLRQIVADNAQEPPGRLGGAVLEHQISYLDWPIAGSRFAIAAALAAVDHRGKTIFSWMADPDTGKPYATARAFLAAFDLDTRSVIPVSDKAQALLRERITPGLPA